MIGKSIPNIKRHIQLRVQAMVYPADLNDWVNSSPGRGAVAPAKIQKQRKDFVNRIKM